jgi:hypothetical protein
MRIVGVVIALAPGLAIAQPAPVYQPMPPPGPTAPPPQPQPERSKWYFNVGIGMGGYVATQDGGEGSGGAALEGQVGAWIRPDFGLGARLEAHSDDPEMYTNSSFTAVARIPVGASGRTYLEPGFGLAFHRVENGSQMEPVGGLAVAITVGRQLARKRFAIDIRGGLSHQRFDDTEISGASHGLIWFGIAAGLQ